MNKMNKKGFTLIEMLVVIAIIAILVAIIIPVVGNSTIRAAAATDAANLRSAKASLTIAYMNGERMSTTGTSMPTNYGTTPVPKSKDAGDFRYNIDTNGEVTVYFGDQMIIDFADIADDGDGTNNSSGTPGKGEVTPGTHTKHEYTKSVKSGSGMSTTYSDHTCTGCTETWKHGRNSCELGSNCPGVQ